MDYITRAVTVTRPLFHRHSSLCWAYVSTEQNSALQVLCYRKLRDVAAVQRPGSPIHFLFSAPKQANQEGQRKCC